MISVTDTTHVRAEPEQVWQFFASMESHYRQWHPDHIAWQDLEGDATQEGSVIYATERLGHRYLRGRFFIDEVEAKRFFSYRLEFPFSLVRAGGSIRLEPSEDGGCDLVAEVHAGYRTPVVGSIIDAILRRRIPVEDLRRHMTEEGRNMDRLLAHSTQRMAA
jgi:hypothetical protein